MRARKHWGVLALLLSLPIDIGGAGSASAAMGAATIMERIHPKDKGKITMDEAREAAGRTYDKVADAHDGKVTMLQLGGRVSADDLKAAGIGDGERDEPVSRADYLALASRFFAEANVSRGQDVSPAEGTLSVDELSTKAGTKLVELIQ